MGDDHRSVEIALEKTVEPHSLVVRQTEPRVKLEGHLAPDLEATPIGKLGYLLALSFDRIAGSGRDSDVGAKPLPLLGRERPVNRTDCADITHLGDVHFLKHINDLRHFCGPRLTSSETLPFSPSPTAEGAAVNKTYHEMIEAVYRGQGYNFHGPGWVEKIAPLRHQRQHLEALVTCPSYHFGKLLMDGAAEFFPKDATQLQPPPVSSILSNLNTIGHRRAAIVFDMRESTCIVTFNNVGGTLNVAICLYDATGQLSVEPNRWIAFTGEFASSFAAWGIIGIAASGLEMLANPLVKLIMAKPASGLAKFSAARLKRGESAVEPMKVIHLTKKVYVGGRAIYPRGEPTGAGHAPHNRAGHYRHSKRRITGWEGPVLETSGEWAGVTCYRRWIDDIKVKGGAPVCGPGRGHPSATLPKAPQYRVVK